ncbi:MAG: hypothetical protein IPP40_13975 [bacterium]|nr:hypothetical protein [bacterium]
MKLKTLLFAGCILLVSGLAHAQFNAGLYDFSGSLADACTGGNPYPDGVTIDIFWEC